MKWVVYCHWVSERCRCCVRVFVGCLLALLSRVNVSRGVVHHARWRPFQVGCRVGRTCDRMVNIGPPTWWL